MQTSHVTLKAQLFEVECRTVKAFCREANTPRCLTVYLLVKYEEWQQLADLGINPRNYTESDRLKFRYDYQATAFLAKSRNLPLDIDKRTRAIEKFYDAERLCEETNKRILSWATDPSEYPEMVDIVARVQQSIAGILGELTTGVLEEVLTKGRFGPGATQTIARRVNEGRKFNNPRPSATPRLAQILVKSLPLMWRESITGIDLSDVTKITTVPKNAKIDRTIGIEADLNVYVQLGIGAVMRERLRSYGMDLDSQERNQRLASLAYANRLATVDLSSASDTVSRAVVHLLLPEEWRHLLYVARSDYYEIDGKISPFEKWSSMGNGYTFELESLLFLAIARACGDAKAISYGDDIVIRAECVPLLNRALDFFGFKVNGEKTYSEGLFYESCGTDWFCGQNVRPIHLKGDTEGSNYDFASTVYTYANQVSEAASRTYRGFGRDIVFAQSWRVLYKSVQPSDRLCVPHGIGGGFGFDWDDPCAQKLPSMLKVRRRVFSPTKYREFREYGPYVAWLARAGRRTDAALSGADRQTSPETFARMMMDLTDGSWSRDGETLRGSGVYSHETRPVFDWPVRGPWI